MISEPVDILAVSPHPDDAELGCSGALILAAEKGLRVAIADVSEGDQASRGTPELRNRERKRAGELIGLCDRLSVGLPDAKIGTDPDHRLPLIRLIRETRPRIILSPYWSDRHPDHAATGRLVKEASFYAGVATVGTGRLYRPEKLFYYMIHHPFQPSFVLDISTVWQRKMEVLAAYKSQFESDGKGFETPISQPEFMKFIEARAVWFGAMIGTSYGEPFLSPGPIPLRELPGIGFRNPTKDGHPAYCMFF